MGANSAVVASSSPIGHIQQSSAPLWLTGAIMLLVDIVSLASVYWLAVMCRYIFTPGSRHLYVELFPGIVCFVAALFVQGLYPGLLLHPAEEMRRVFNSVTIVFMLVGSITFLWHSAEWYSRSILLIIWAAAAPIVVMARRFARRRLQRTSWWGVPVVVLGAGKTAKRVIRTLHEQGLGLRVAAVLADDCGAEWGDDLPPIVGALSEAPRMASLNLAHYVILALPHRSNQELRDMIEDHCEGFKHILLVPDLAGLCSIGICTREIGGEVGFELPQRLCHPTAAILKRTLDCLFSLGALLILSPIFLWISIAVKLTSRGPVFFGHLRYGRDGKSFRALKFRTMVPDADRVLEEYLKNHPNQLSQWQRDHKLRQDPRVTSIGKWMRRFSIDEIPQLLNVLVGQMSLVGPRPIVKAEISKYGRGYRLYKRVVPGITGLWQVSGRNNTTYDERVSLDEYYVRNWSIWLDAYILLRTIKVVCTGEGAY